MRVLSGVGSMLTFFCLVVCKHGGFYLAMVTWRYF
nr:MAG TPA: hypothetical protein [Caudoviricetes sp.]